MNEEIDVTRLSHNGIQGMATLGTTFLTILNTNNK